jgi:hypothetical protein
MLTAASLQVRFVAAVGAPAGVAVAAAEALHATVRFVDPWDLIAVLDVATDEDDTVCKRKQSLRMDLPSPDNLYVMKIHQFASDSGCICGTFVVRSR